MLPSGRTAPDSKTTAPRRVAHDDVQPRAPRRIGRRQLVPRRARDVERELEAARRALRRGDRKRRRTRAEETPRLRGRGFELLRQRLHAELAAIPAQDVEHERVGAEERVLRHVRPRLAEHGRDRRFGGDLRHVAALAAIRRAVVAVQPLLIRHLLRQRADRLPGFVERAS